MPKTNSAEQSREFTVQGFDCLTEVPESRPFAGRLATISATAAMQLQNEQRC
jgi:hypothetical protein